MFETVLTDTATLSIGSALLCTAVSLVLGLIIAFVYIRKGDCTKNFAITLTLLPVLVQVVIMMVNGNLGTGVAVLGAFSLVRFRSVPGSSKEIIAIFFAMAVGIATSMGYLTFAAAVTIIVSLVMLLLSSTRFGEQPENEKELRITIPEDLDYTGVFDDLFATYTTKFTLERVKTVNLGSMYELRYTVKLKDMAREKAFIDDLRCRNGNLTIVCGRKAVKEEL